MIVLTEIDRIPLEAVKNLVISLADFAQEIPDESLRLIWANIGVGFTEAVAERDDFDATGEDLQRCGAQMTYLAAATRLAEILGDT